MTGKKTMNQRNNTVETHRIKDRMRDIFILFTFVILAAVASVIVMDILVLPITIFAVNFKSAFNFILSDLLWLVVVILLIGLLAVRVLVLRKNGLSFREILNHVAYRPFSALATFLMIMGASAVLIMIIYLLLSYNNYFIYKLIN